MAEVTVAAWVSAKAAFSIIAPAPNKVVAAKTPLKILVVRLSLSFNGRWLRCCLVIPTRAAKLWAFALPV